MLSNKKASVKNNITLEQWKVYFERLFEYNGEPNEQDIINIFEEEPVLGDVEYFIFNSEITEEEILRVGRALKQEKSAGPDSIVPALFINCIELILPILHKLFQQNF